MKTIAVTNQKGGAGKTSTALSLATGLTHMGYKVLLIDMDAQCNSTSGMGYHSFTGESSMDILKDRREAASLVVHTENGDIIPGSPSLATADVVVMDIGKEYRLRKSLESVSGDYDFCVIDTPPAIGTVTINALTACDGVIIPSEADSFSLMGIGQLSHSLESVKEFLNPDIRVIGILLTDYYPRNIITRKMTEFAEATAEQMNTVVFGTKIRHCTDISKSQALGVSIYKYSQSSNAAVDCMNFVKEFLNLIGEGK